MNYFKFITLTTFISIFFICSFLITFYDLLSLEFIKETFTLAENDIKKNYALYLLFFFILYVITTSLFIPIASGLSILIGALFNFLDAVLIVSAGSSIGATANFLISRYALKSYLEIKFRSQLIKINKGVEKNGIYYLFFLRLAPIFPYFIINAVFGITKIKVVTFFFISLFGMLPGIFLYVNAGSQISKIASIKELYSMNIIFSFFILGIFPLITKKVLYLLKIIRK